MLKLGYTISHNSHYGVGADVFSSRVAAATKGAWMIEQNPDGFLGGEVEMIENLRMGELDLGIIYTGVLSGTMPELGLFDLPFLFRDVAHAVAVFDGPIGQSYLTRLRKHDMIGLAWGENGVRHITNSKRPIRTPADLHGLKIRVPQSDVILRCFRQLGADAEPLSFPAVYGALESGRFDGQENAISTLRAARLDRVQRHLTLSGHIYGATIFAMSRDCWDDLTEAEKDIFIDAARHGGKASRRAAREAEESGISAMREQGNEVVPVIDQDAFLQALEPTWSQIAGQFGRGNIDQLRAYR